MRATAAQLDELIAKLEAHPFAWHFLTEAERKFILVALKFSTYAMRDRADREQQETAQEQKKDNNETS
jgi:hypothetical protein